METALQISTYDAFANSIHFWERGRILYNVTLILIVTAVFLANWPTSMARLTLNLGQGLFVLAVLANVAYCAAYPVDVFVQLSAVRCTWLRFRWLLFVIGLLFASIITRFLAQPMFGHAA
jgi:hypothetical protein